MKPQFKIGAKVDVPAFIDCFGRTTNAHLNLTVSRVRLCDPSGKPYYRVQAERSGYGSIEAAERFFRAEVSA